jgi:hypothetical protein
MSSHVFMFALPTAEETFVQMGWWWCYSGSGGGKLPGAGFIWLRRGAGGGLL